ncbi:biopolymer transporter ExbD [Verrucomicrobiales bacterium]|nr:biopolymer transporter ExbD [Verrucomicrobiales bacterium]
MNVSPQPKKSRIPLWVFLGVLGIGFFCLVIGGIVVWQYNQFERVIDISVPAVETLADKERQVGEIVINIRENGDVVLNNNVITLETLKQRLDKIAAEFPDQAVILRGDTSAEFKHIIDVLDEIKAAGIWNVAFATTKS